MLQPANQRLSLTRSGVEKASQAEYAGSIPVIGSTDPSRDIPEKESRLLSLAAQLPEPPPKMPPPRPYPPLPLPPPKIPPPEDSVVGKETEGLRPERLGASAGAS